LANPDCLIRNAKTSEAEPLSRLALRSKAYWGYDAAFLEACREELTVTTEMIIADEVRVATRAGVLQGLYRLSASGRDASVELLYVAPEAIGTGVGRQLWEDLIVHAAVDGATRLLIEADPHAETFYVRMGAVRTGSCPSGSIPDRMLPLLELSLRDGT
jgi:GNAT superfamily N-acetyltransferase